MSGSSMPSTRPPPSPQRSRSLGLQRSRASEDQVSECSQNICSTPCTGAFDVGADRAPRDELEVVLWKRRCIVDGIDPEEALVGAPLDSPGCGSSRPDPTRQIKSWQQEGLDTLRKHRDQNSSRSTRIGNTIASTSVATPLAHERCSLGTPSTAPSSSFDDSISPDNIFSLCSDDAAACHSDDSNSPNHTCVATHDLFSPLSNHASDGEVLFDCDGEADIDNDDEDPVEYLALEIVNHCPPALAAQVMEALRSKNKSCPQTVEQLDAPTVEHLDAQTQSSPWNESPPEESSPCSWKGRGIFAVAILAIVFGMISALLQQQRMDCMATIDTSATEVVPFTNVDGLTAELGECRQELASTKASVVGQQNEFAAMAQKLDLTLAEVILLEKRLAAREEDFAVEIQQYKNELNSCTKTASLTEADLTSSKDTLNAQEVKFTLELNQCKDRLDACTESVRVTQVEFSSAEADLSSQAATAAAKESQLKSEVESCTQHLHAVKEDLVSAQTNLAAQASDATRSGDQQREELHSCLEAMNSTQVELDATRAESSLQKSQLTQELDGLKKEALELRRARTESSMHRSEATAELERLKKELDSSLASLASTQAELDSQTSRCSLEAQRSKEDMQGCIAARENAERLQVTAQTEADLLKSQLATQNEEFDKERKVIAKDLANALGELTILNDGIKSHISARENAERLQATAERELRIYMSNVVVQKKQTEKTQQAEAQALANARADVTGLKEDIKRHMSARESAERLQATTQKELNTLTSKMAEQKEEFEKTRKVDAQGLFEAQAELTVLKEEIRNHISSRENAEKLLAHAQQQYEAMKEQSVTRVAEAQEACAWSLNMTRADLGAVKAKLEDVQGTLEDCETKRSSCEQGRAKVGRFVADWCVAVRGLLTSEGRSSSLGDCNDAVGSEDGSGLQMWLQSSLLSLQAWRQDMQKCKTS